MILKDKVKDFSLYKNDTNAYENLVVILEIIDKEIY